jgi:hypothetical protein
MSFREGYAKKLGVATFMGSWNAATNTPSLQSGIGAKGEYYVVSVAGSTLLDGVSTWEYGDQVRFNGSTWERLDTADSESLIIDEHTAAFYESKEPTGHADITKSTLAFDEATRTLSISPSQTSFDIWVRGKKITISSTLTKQIPNTSGSYFFVIDSTGALDYRQTFDITILTELVYTAYVYWNADDGKATSFGEERHGISMDGTTHGYLHSTRGTQLVSGASIGYTVGDGSLSSHAQISISDCQLRDEDIRADVRHSATPSVKWEQILSPTAKIPVYYRNGSYWTKAVATDYPIKQGTSRAQYNKFTASWSAVDADADGNFLVSYIFGTTNINEPIISLLGQDQYTSVEDAKARAAWSKVSFGDLPAQEMKLLYILIYETSSAFSNTPKAAIKDVLDLRFGADREVSATSFNTAHSNLSGLGLDDHVQYLPVSGIRGMSGDLDMNSNDITEVNSLNGITSTEIGYLSGIQSSVQTQISSKEPSITAGTTEQYWRGDKSWQTLDKSAVGLGNVPNVDATARANHTGTQTASTISDFTLAVQAVTLDAAKIGSGTVSNTEFGYLDGVTSSIQTQLGGKEPSITAGTTAQYYRGDKTFQTLNAAAVTNTPAGTIAATTVQAAINELGTEKQPVGNYITDLTGDVTASGPGSAAATLSNSGVAAGTYDRVTVDAKGRVTAGAVTTLFYVTSSPFSTPSSTYTTVTGLTSASLAAGLYRFYFTGQASSASLNSGVGVRIATVSAPMTTVTVKWNISQGGDGTAHDFEYDQLSPLTNVTSASVSAAGTNFAVNGSGVFRVSAPGTVAIQFRSETNGTTSVLAADSVFVIESIV